MHQSVAKAKMSSLSSSYNYETMKVDLLDKHVVGVALNRPKKRNAMNKTMWMEIGEVFSRLSNDPECRSIVLSGEGKVFTAGIDLSDLVGMAEVVLSDQDIARKCFQMKNIIRPFQESFSQLEKCRKPVVCAIHGPCVGAGVDLIVGADVRYSTSDAWFQVKEVEIGLAADVGTLQRLPKVLGSQSLVNELCLTCRVLPAAEALSCGLTSRLFQDKETMMTAAVDCARQIATNSPVAVQVTKMALVHARDHTVEEGLEYMTLLNMTMLQSEDLRISAMSQIEKSKTKPTFADL